MTGNGVLLVLSSACNFMHNNNNSLKLIFLFLLNRIKKLTNQVRCIMPGAMYINIQSTDGRVLNLIAWLGWNASVRPTTKLKPLHHIATCNQTYDTSSHSRMFAQDKMGVVLVHCIINTAQQKLVRMLKQISDLNPLSL